MPGARLTHIVLVGTNLVEFRIALVLHRRSTVGRLDVGLGNQGKEAVLRFQQHRIAPVARTHIASSRQREETLIAHIPLHHPAASSFGNAVDGLFVLYEFAAQAVHLITESHTIVEHEENEANGFAARTIVVEEGIGIGGVRSMARLARQHPIVGLEAALLQHIGRFPCTCLTAGCHTDSRHFDHQFVTTKNTEHSICRPFNRHLAMRRHTHLRLYAQRTEQHDTQDCFFHCIIRLT